MYLTSHLFHATGNWQCIEFNEKYKRLPTNKEKKPNNDDNDKKGKKEYDFKFAFIHSFNANETFSPI